MRTPTWVGIALVAALAATGCGDDGSGDDGATGGSDPILIALDLGSAEADGVVSRTVAVADDGDGDGMGILHLTVDGDCRNDLGSGIPPLATLVVDDPVSVAADDDEVPFRVTGLADGTYFASGWIDDVDNPEQEEDLPATGDLVMFGDLSPRCVQFEVVDGQADPIDLDLDYEMPFTLPGFEGDEGILEGDGEPSVDPSTIVDDGSTHTVTIELSRSVEPDLGGDGAGGWLAGLFPSCFDDETGATPVPDVAHVVPEVALEATDEPVELRINNVANGVYSLNGFIDDAAVEGDDAPRPGIGDLVSFGGFGPACAEVVVDGTDVTVAFDLNLVLPFDL